MDLQTLKTINLHCWNVMKISPHYEALFNHVARQLVASKTRYQAVSAETAVPWAFIAVVHEREASQSWAANLAQGDPWDKISVHVPRGRGPFPSWKDAAIDALEQCAPYAARNVKGKYVADGHFDPEAVDHQLGCAGLLKAMIEIDPSITFTDEASA